MKVFISYSRIEASETAKTLHNYLTEYGNHEVFIDTSDIPGGDEWWNTIQNAISDCDIFVIIVTRSALERQYIKDEVELAKKLKKKIIPCISKKYIRNVVLPLDLSKYQGIEYENLDQLIQEIGHVFESLEKYQNKQPYSTSIDKQNLEIPTHGKNFIIDNPSKEQSVSHAGKNINKSFLKGFKPKIIIISIIAIAIIGLVVSIYFSVLPTNDNTQILTKFETKEQQTLPNGRVTDIGNDFAVYENSNYGIRIEYPSNWTTSTQEAPIYSVGTYIDGFWSPDRMASFNIEIEDTTKDFDDYMTAKYKDLNELTNYTVYDIRERIIDGYPANQITYTYTDLYNNNQNNSIMNLFTKVDNRVFIFTYVSNKEKFPQYLPLVDNMIDSLNLK